MTNLWEIPQFGYFPCHVPYHKNLACFPLPPCIRNKCHFARLSSESVVQFLKLQQAKIVNCSSRILKSFPPTRPLSTSVISVETRFGIGNIWVWMEALTVKLNYNGAVALIIVLAAVIKIYLPQGTQWKSRRTSPDITVSNSLSVLY